MSESCECSMRTMWPDEDELFDGGNIHSRLRCCSMRDEIERLRRALAEPAERNTNEFWADGMRVGKALGFKNGIEAAALVINTKTIDSRFLATVNGMVYRIRALAQPAEPAPCEHANTVRRRDGSKCLDCGEPLLGVFK